MANKEDIARLMERGICPECGGKLVHIEGCVECSTCGWSLCEEA